MKYGRLYDADRLIPAVAASVGEAQITIAECVRAAREAEAEAWCQSIIDWANGIKHGEYAEDALARQPEEFSTGDPEIDRLYQLKATLEFKAIQAAAAAAKFRRPPLRAAIRRGARQKSER